MYGSTTSTSRMNFKTRTRDVLAGSQARKPLFSGYKQWMMTRLSFFHLYCWIRQMMRALSSNGTSFCGSWLPSSSPALRCNIMETIILHFFILGERRKHVMTTEGSLLIFNVTARDNGTQVGCRTVHRLSGNIVASQPPAKLHVSGIYITSYHNILKLY
jgi:hypothetical protein